MALPPLPPSPQGAPSESAAKDFFDDRIRQSLEDFEIVGTPPYLVLTSRQLNLKEFQKNLRATVVAAAANLAGVDYARRRYCNDEINSHQTDASLIAYIAAYRSSKAYVARMLAKLRIKDLPDPTAGVFSASLVLERLRSSFFSAHFLYRMGHRYEGHAVSRLILEQIAWAYAAHGFNDVDKLKKIRATKAITELKKFAPEAGPLYGLLRKETHIGFAKHPSFITIDSGRNTIWFAQPQFLEYGRVILLLADMFGIVWELSQRSYIPTVEAIRTGPAGSSINPDRPFLKDIQKCLVRLQEAKSKQADPG
jgi:hypothetical protein